MKIIKKLIIGLFLAIGLFSINFTTHGAVEGLDSIGGKYTQFETKGSIGKTIEVNGFKLINWVKIIFSAVLVILIVYAGIQMILSMGTDDDQLSKAKRTLWYALVGIIFINFPVQIYESFMSPGSEAARGTDGNILVLNGFENLMISILKSVELLIGGIAVFILVFEGIKIIINSKEEESLTKSKNKILWVLIGLVFIGFIEIWIKFLETGNIRTSTSIFSSVANLALYIAGPVALFFLTLAGYYYIFSNGDDEKMKKGKNIVINTSIGIIILLCIYVLLNDISLLNF